MTKPRLFRHFTRCATMAACSAGFTKQADAALVHSGVVSINIPSNTAGVYLNVVTGVHSSFPAGAAGWDVNPWGSSSLNMFTPTPSPGGGAYVGAGSAYHNLPMATFVGPSSSWSAIGTLTSVPDSPLVLNSSSNLIGFRFVNEANAGLIHYGWMRIQLSASSFSQPRTIVEYMYENVAGQGIFVGILTPPPPSPGSVPLMVIAATFGGSRRRRASISAS